MKHAVFIAGITLALTTLQAWAQQKDERGGTCEQTKQQWDYYCNGKGDPNDQFTTANIACNNAKRNMAAACEGKTEQDYSYEFKKDGAPKQ